jgi:site-specific DNA recombinase
MKNNPNEPSSTSKEQVWRRALIYIRSATRDQVDPLGAKNIRVQSQACRARAKQLGAIAEAEYSDIGLGGRNRRNPALSRLLKRLEQEPTIDYVIVHRLDRLTRRLDTNLELVRDIEATGTSLVSCTADVLPSQRLLEGMTNLIADFYAREHSRRIKEGLARKKQRAAAREAA